MTFLSKGLYAKGQKELSLTLLNNNNDFKTVLEKVSYFFKLIYQYTINGTIVIEGETTEFGKNDFLGWKGILYAELCVEFKDYIIAPTLLMILVTEKELKSIKTHGSMRILSMLGKENTFFPYPFWSDLSRKELPIEKMKQKSFLSKIQASMTLNRSSVTLKENNIYFQISKYQNLNLPKEGMPLNITIAIFPTLNLHSEGCFTFTFDNIENGPVAITAPNKKGNTIGGCFIIILPNQEEYSARIVEDGFCIMVTDNQWIAIWDTIQNKKNLVIDDKKSLPFHINWY